MRPTIRNSRFMFTICATAAATMIAASLPTAALASTEAGCVGASRKMEPNGADAVCVQGADFITVHITCVDVTTALYYDRSGDRNWSNAQDPMLGGSRVYCDFPGDPLLSHSFSVG